MPHLISIKAVLLFMIAGLLALASCSDHSEPTFLQEATQEILPTITYTQISLEEGKEIAATPESINEDNSDELMQVDGEKEIMANIVSVKVNGSAHQYQFSVGISSPDTGCEQFADWWEVLSEDGELIYRRILLHSHVNEQPFIRSGGPVDLEEDSVVFIRAHMNQAGFGGNIMKGSVKSGFILVQNQPVFPDSIESEAPLPTDCNF